MSLVCLWKKLSAEDSISFLATQRLKQDPIENFFRAIRQHGGNADNPTPVHFMRAYRKLFRTNLLSIATGNCENDNEDVLANLTDLQDIDKSPMNTDKDQATLKFVDNDVKAEQIQDKIAKENALAHVAGYLLKKTVKKHKC